jgi:hypothetical protein
MTELANLDMGTFRLFMVFVGLLGGVLGTQEPAEKKLHDYLLGNKYSKLIRPTGNSSVKLTVKLGLRLSQLLEIVSKLSRCGNDGGSCFQG